MPSDPEIEVTTEQTMGSDRGVGAEVSGRHLFLGHFKLHKTSTDLQPGATEGIMVDIDVSLHTRAERQAQIAEKSTGIMHLLPIKMLHAAYEVIMIAKQVLLPELVRTKFPDWSVWLKLACSARQQTGC